MLKHRTQILYAADIALVCTLYIMWAINQTRLGRAFDAIRQEAAIWRVSGGGVERV